MTMTKDEEQMIANLMHRMHANEQARIESALATARMDAVTRAEADRVRIEALTTERDQWKFSHTDLLGRLGFQAAKEAGKVLGMVDGEGLRGAAERVVKERDGLLTQVQDMRAEIDSLKREERATHDTLKPLVERVTSERDALRAKVAALQESLGSEKKQGDALWCEVHELRKLKSQTPKHPVKVGEWVRRTTAGSVAPIGTAGSVMVAWSDAYQVQLRKGFSTLWSFGDCTPCDPPTEATHDTPDGRNVAESVIRDDRNTEPKRGDTVRLVRVPTADEYPLLPSGWVKGWGDVGDARRVCLVQDSAVNRRVVVLDNGFEWPLSCVEVVRAEPDKIKVGDVVEVFQATDSNWTRADEIGIKGTVTSINMGGHMIPVVYLSNNGAYALQDVRKVTP
jgi:hypothetical protein